MTHRPVLSLVLAFAAACETAAPEVDPLPPPAEGSGFQLAIEYSAPASSETWKCVIMELPNREDFVYVDRAEHVQSGLVHHMDLSVLASSGLDRPAGVYDCEPLYQEYPGLMEETILYAAQSEKLAIDIPNGYVAAIPPGLKAMYEVHFLNTSDREVTIYSKLNAYTIAKEEVKGYIWGHAVRDRHLNIRARSETVEWSRCVFDQDVEVLFLATHTHQLAKDTTVFRYDGSATREEVYKNTDWETPQIKALSPPMRVAKGEGFEFRCRYENPLDRDVNWGLLAADEMCNLAVVFAPGDQNNRCRVIETSDGVIME